MKSSLATPVVIYDHQSVVSSILKIGIDCSQLLSRRIARLRCNFLVVFISGQVLMESGGTRKIIPHLLLKLKYLLKVNIPNICIINMKNGG